MHIEPGYLSAAKVAAANAAAISLAAASFPPYVRDLSLWARTAVSAAFFTVFMSVWHVPVGASELHFIGVSLIYFLFGFRPALFGFAAGLGLQGLLFEPADLAHLGVNSLSLMIPLMAAHFAAGGGGEAGWARILRFDAVFYGGVTVMVGFWLSIGTAPVTFAAWLAFAVSYFPIVLAESLVTLGALALAGRFSSHAVIRQLIVQRL